MKGLILSNDDTRATIKSHQAKWHEGIDLKITKCLFILLCFNQRRHIPSVHFQSPFLQVPKSIQARLK